MRDNPLANWLSRTLPYSAFSCSSAVFSTLGPAAVFRPKKCSQKVTNVCPPRVEILMRNQQQQRQHRQQQRQHRLQHPPGFGFPGSPGSPGSSWLSWLLLASLALPGSPLAPSWLPWLPLAPPGSSSHPDRFPGSHCLLLTPGRAGRSQEEPGGARRSQKPRARTSQEEPGGARESQGDLGRACRESQEEPGRARESQGDLLENQKNRPERWKNQPEKSIRKRGQGGSRLGAHRTRGEQS